MHETEELLAEAEHLIETGRIQDGYARINGARDRLQKQLKKNPREVAEALGLPDEPQLV